MNVPNKPSKKTKKEKVPPAVKKAVEAFKKGKGRKSKVVKDEITQDEGVLATPVTQESPAEVEKVEEPTLIRLSKKFGSIGGAALGGLAGSKFGMGVQGSSLGAKYGGQIAQYGVKRLLEYAPILGSFRRGGQVRRTGAYILHKGEKVVPVKKVRKSKY